MEFNLINTLALQPRRVQSFISIHISLEGDTDFVFTNWLYSLHPLHCSPSLTVPYVTVLPPYSLHVLFISFMPNLLFKWSHIVLTFFSLTKR